MAASLPQVPLVLESHVSPDIFLHFPTSLTPLRTKPRECGDGTSTTASERNNNAPKTTIDTTAATTTPASLNLVFFITGNPGLIAYYQPFLAGLVDAFDGQEYEKEGADDGPRARFGGRTVAPLAVAGFSLGGFEVEDWDFGSTMEQLSALNEGSESQIRRSDRHESLRDLLFPGSTSLSLWSSREKIYSLAEQVELCYARLKNLVGRLQWHFSDGPARSRREGGGEGEGGKEGGDATADTDIANVEVNVTLIGHSVGAYIALELVRLWHERSGGGRLLPSPLSHESATRSSTTTPTPPAPASTKWTITSSILLTPTIQDLDLSPSGRIASPLLTYAPFLPTLAHALVQSLLVKWLPGPWVAALVQRATGMQAGSHGLLTTVAFLRSRTGVRQALEMAKCELREIRRESWGREVWGATHTGEEDGNVERNPRLYFWFAKEDHWVADVTRDEIFRRRGQCQTSLGESNSKVGLGDDFQAGAYHSARTRTPKILIDETEGLVHAWCLTQTELVTQRVTGWLKELWEENK